jgi:hypothetical protein
MFEAITADEMAGRERDQPRVFVHLPDHVNRADNAETARVEQTDLDAFLRERHPRINIGGIIVVINQDVVAFAEIQAGRDEAQPKRGRPDERDFIGLAVQQLRREFACVVQAVQHEGFLVAQRGLPGAFGNGGGDAARQRADASVAEKDFVAGDRKFVPAQFFIGQDFIQHHRAKIIFKSAKCGIKIRRRWWRSAGNNPSRT